MLRILSLLLLALTASAQTPIVVSKQQSVKPSQPLPVSVTAGPRAITLPRDEKLLVVDQRSLRVQYLANRLVLTNNNQVFRQFDSKSNDAEVVKQLLNDLVVVRWGTIGVQRIVVEYGLTLDARGEVVVPPNAGFPQGVVSFDLKSLRVEAVRGAWCVRDNDSIILNFGLEKLEAEQAVAVCQKYGFNRLGTVGRGREPAVTYFIAATDTTPGASPTKSADLQRQVLTRTGIDVPGLGFIGERIAIEPKKLEVRRDGSDVTLRMGNEILAHFGSDEWAARDAVRVIEQARFTEFCRFGGMTFFLVKGKAPTAVPFHARSTRFDPASLRSRELNGKWYAIDASGRPVLPATDEKEAVEIVKIVKAFGFDTVATVGNSPTANLQFLVKSR